MKAMLEELLSHAIGVLKAQDVIPADCDAISRIKIDATKDKSHGDFATNIALMLAKSCGLKPSELASMIIEALPKETWLLRAEVAGPGFINFFIDKASRAATILDKVLKAGDAYGRSDLGARQKVLLEYVSANPTGPLHVGHGRGAAFGASLANLLDIAGFDVTREYYVNDAGRQMDILAVSVWLRYLALLGERFIFPSNGYQGGYVIDIAQLLHDQYGQTYQKASKDVFFDIPKDAPDGGDKETHIDGLITNAKILLGDAGFLVFHKAALEFVLEDIKADLEAFGVTYDQWFSERSLLDSGAIEKGIQALKGAGFTYEEKGAIWFRSTDFGDEKDRVLVRANGQPTYFASDVAYHWDKYRRGYDLVMDLFGADHHGYVPRLKAAVSALGHDESDLHVFMVQFAILYREGERVQMSTRSGSFVTLRELREEVGKDAARFFYVMRKPEQHMDFDLDLAKSESRDNPVYYVQYAHARICSVFRQLSDRGLQYDADVAITHAALLTESYETALIASIDKYPEVIVSAARAREPHQVAYYLRELANGLHAYYNAISLLCEDEALRLARLSLISAVAVVLNNGLQLLGVSAPRSM